MEIKKTVRNIGAQEPDKTEIDYSIILFDGICNFCNSSVNFIIKHDLNNYFRFAPLQSEIAKQLLLQLGEQNPNINTIILIEKNKIYRQSDAILRIAKHFNGAYSVIPEGGKQEELVREAFTLFATGMYAIDDLRRKMNGKGLMCSRQAFWLLLRNKSYIGKVFVPAYKDEPAVCVEGQHKGIIDETIFLSGTRCFVRSQT